MKRRLMVAVVVIVALVGAVFLSACAAPEAEKPIEWRMQVYVPVKGPPITLAADAFAQAVEERSGGRLKIHTYYSGELGIGAGDYLKAVQAGAIDIAAAADAYYTGEIPVMALNNWYWLGYDAETYIALEETLRPYYEKALNEKFNITQLWSGSWWSTMVYPFGKEPIEDWFDLKGFKMRVYSPEHADFYEMIGGTGVFIPWGEVYTSLDKGVVDGYTSDIVKFESLKLYEVINYFYDLPIGPGTAIWFMSQSSLDALPADLQKIVMEEGRPKGDLFHTIGVQMEKENRALSDAKGVQRVVVDQATIAQLRAMIQDQLHPKWKQALDADALTAYDEVIKLMQ